MDPKTKIAKKTGNGTFCRKNFYIFFYTGFSRPTPEEYWMQNATDTDDIEDTLKKAHSTV
jgi:hypothetical protein